MWEIVLSGCGSKLGSRNIISKQKMTKGKDKKYEQEKM